MNSSKLLLPFFLIASVFSTTAQAGGWVEPAIGFQSSSYKMTDLSESTNTGKGSGFAATLKMGYIFTSNIALGIEYDYGNHKATDDSNNIEYTTTSNILGVHFGYYKVGGVRFYGTYGISNALHVKPDTGFEADYKQGTAYKIGVGWQVALHVALNLEYLKYEPKKYSVGGGPEGDISDTFSKVEFSAMRFLVSFPFE